MNTGTLTDTRRCKIVAYYNSVVDTDGRNAAGIAPIKEDLDAIAAAQSLDDLCRLSLLDDAETGLSVMFDWGFTPDPWDTSHYMLSLEAAAPLATVDVYDGSNPTAYDAYVRYLTTLLTLSGKVKTTQPTWQKII